MWFRIWDNCLRPSGDPTAGSVELAVDQQDHRWILSLGIFCLYIIHLCHHNSFSCLPAFSNIFMNKFFSLSDIISSVHLPGPDHEAGSKDQVRKHRQYYRVETEQRADYQGEEKVPLSLF